ncbi:hypothetical protein TA3x_005599 [Tundrisphaera sp. TA3]|uniref:hypothetical protein n=1 Tax=Tundrisphaera sp. TA3 TaxID=3435775 RepID=UPI003EBCDFB8
MPPFVPRLVGDPKFRRYVVRDRKRQGEWFWTGQGWSRRLREALLFADPDDVNRQIARLYADLLR